MALTLGSRIGVYEITAPIGEGGMGQVYRATDTTLGRQVAIKILPAEFASDPERLARFEREAKTLASLNHPHIAAIYGFEKSAGMHALVMELVEGEDLSQRIGRGAIPLDEALPIAKQIADALEAAHEQGFIHRDLKPANIKVRSDGTVKVLDFGLAKAMEPEAGSSPSVSMSPTITTPAMTQAGMILGTAAYMSPEQAKGRTVDKRSDVWSFGAVLYEMLTGRRAFDAEDVPETFAAVLMKEPDWAALPGNTPWNTRRLLRRCCEKDPRRRMRDMGDVALELGDVAPEAFGKAEGQGGIRWQMAGPVVLLLVLFAYFGGTWRSTPSTGATTEWIGERLGGPTVACFPVLSPDETLLTFTVMDRGLTQIGVMQAGGIGGSRQLTHDRTRGYASLAAWSADSSRIYFDRTSRDGTNIYSISVVGDGEERLVLEDATSPRPLADGSLLAVRTNSERVPQLIRFRPTINKLETLPVLLVDTLLDQAIKVLSGPRRVLVAGRPQGTPASENHLYLVDPDTGDMRRIAPDLTLPLFEWEFPLAATEDEVYFNVPAGDLHRIVAVKLDGSPGVRTVLSLSRRPIAIDVARDGTLYLDQIDQPTEILRIDAGTSNVEHFPLSTYFDYVLPLPNDIFLVARLGGSRPRLLRVTPPGAPTPFLDTDAEARGPLALIGDSLVAFAIGPATDQQVALASLDGRLQRRIPIRNEGEVTGLAASPDGTSLYYAVDNVVYRVPVVGGESTPVSRGQAVTVDPSTGHLVILRRGDVAEVVRVPAAGGTETSLAVTGEWRVYGLGVVNLMGNAIASDGRLLIRTLPPASWMFPVGILDGRKGGRIMPFLDPLDTDMLAAVWDRAGRVVALARPFRSELWSFRPMPAR